MIIVSDASPIISLARAGLLGLLRDLFQQVVIPSEIYQEVVVRGKGKAGALETESADWIKAEEVKDRDLISRLQVRGLSIMDAATIALAREKKANFVIIDEKRARDVARGEGLRVIGLGGILLEAKRKRLISNVKEPLDLLIRNKARIHPRLYEEILRRAGE